MLCFMICLVAVPDKIKISSQCNYVKSVGYTCNLECVCPKDFQFQKDLRIRSSGACVFRECSNLIS